MIKDELDPSRPAPRIDPGMKNVTAHAVALEQGHAIEGKKNDAACIQTDMLSRLPKR